MLCNDKESILLDSKLSQSTGHCLGIKDKDYGKFSNYEIQVDLLSLESNEGQNSGYLGIAFNYLNEQNYDFLYLELHNDVPSEPPKLRNITQAFISGYRLNGEIFFDERVILETNIPSNVFHSLRIVIDKSSIRSTKVFVDDTYVGHFREHFVTRLKGGVFVFNKFGSVGLFENFVLKGCKRFDENAECKDDNWIPIMKIAEDSTFGYTSPYWTNEKLLNENSLPNANINAKYAAFLNTPFNQIRMCSRNNCVAYFFKKPWDSARQLFSSGFQRAADLDQADLLAVFDPCLGDYRDCGMQRPGFNIECLGENNRARWGYCANCPQQACQVADSDDADSTIGIGLTGENTNVEMGAGWTEYFASGKDKCLANSKTFKSILVSVRKV